MEYEIIESDEKPYYPRLMQTKLGCVALFTGEYTGTVLVPSTIKSEWQTGAVLSSTNINSWYDFTGSLVLKN